jgi:hypothetical protein
VRVAVQRLAAGTNEAVGAVEVRVAGGRIEAKWTCDPRRTDSADEDAAVRDVEAYVAVVGADGTPQRVRTDPLRVVGSRLVPVPTDGGAPASTAQFPFCISA